MLCLAPPLFSFLLVFFCFEKKCNLQITGPFLITLSSQDFCHEIVKISSSDVCKRPIGCFFFLLTGFTDGSVVLTKGDITRDRHSKTLTLHEGTSPVTGLAFRQVAKVTHLFVATLEKVHVSFWFVR